MCMCMCMCVSECELTCIFSVYMSLCTCMFHKCKQEHVRMHVNP